ncbi:O-fucosyltransferase [Trema orientale]|uniref:O-fucosyltransferase family protein n=1 Tax=Trema orientale TaxID=63057 RepID=A0A2P5DFZ1_TREOI|nr:O-fucosyltransferase [Trema orientale]
MAFMARPRTTMKNSIITINPSFSFFHFLPPSPLTSLLFSPKKASRNLNQCPNYSTTLLLFSLSLLFSFTFLLGIFLLGFLRSYQTSPLPCSVSSPQFFATSLSSVSDDDGSPRLSYSAMVPLPSHGLTGNLSDAEREFWKQPEGEGYRPCLEFTIGYRKASAGISKEKRRFLMVVASGGLNQQRNQIVDAVVIARVLEAALVVPILQVNLIWGDESEFSDIFDVEHFKKTLQADVRVVSTIPSTHLMSRQSIQSKIPRDITPQWIHSRFFNQLNQDGLLVLKGLDSKLTKNLPPDLQKLKCKVAFHALRFAAPIRELGNQLAKRMWIEGPYIALHLRLEKDVWVRTGCLTGLGPEYDDVITKVRESQPELLTGSLNMSHSQRKLAGLCPLNAFEMARLLKALGAPRTTRIYNAGGEPFGGGKALQPLVAEFPNLVTKEMLARGGELSPFVNKSSALAAIDYVVSLSSDVFVPSHGGNMGRALQGHRAYVGHRKFIKPNKRAMLPFFEDTAISEVDFGGVVRELHRKSQGQPEPRNYRRDRDVIAYPVPECMCQKPQTRIF